MNSDIDNTCTNCTKCTSAQVMKEVSGDKKKNSRSILINCGEVSTF